jgi:hypothetical protein
LVFSLFDHQNPFLAGDRRKGCAIWVRGLSSLSSGQ